MQENQTETFEDSARAQRAEPVRPLPHLFLVLECDRPSAGGARYCLEGIESVEVGRSAERSARIESTGPQRLYVGVPGRSMSATHAVLVRQGGGFRLEDSGSTNGSFVNGTRVEAASVSDGDVIELGHTLFTLRTALATPAFTPALFDTSEQQPAHPGLATLLPPLAEEFATLARIAGSDLPVLLVGDTGTGKELTARAVHALSGRAGPFVAVNCGALAPNLVESLLFGHAKGAFSGAHRDEAGFLRAAEHGTLLLDEIGDLPLSAQAALLRVLQEREVVPVGSARPLPFQARVIAATHRDLETLVANERFRGDLLARLDGYRCNLPPLSARREDLGLFVREVLRGVDDGGAVRFAPDAGTALALHDWPFNVRELVQELKRAIVVSGGGLIQKAHVLLSRGTGTGAASGGRAEADRLSPEDAKLREELVQRLSEHRGNVAEVARAMNKARMQIHRWLGRFGIDPGVYRLKDPPGER